MQLPCHHAGGNRRKDRRTKLFIQRRLRERDFSAADFISKRVQVAADMLKSRWTHGEGIAAVGMPQQLVGENVIAGIEGTDKV